jgi:two-component system LytT family response regulator
VNSILKTSNRFEEKLDAKPFFRANRKFIINLEWIENIENWFNGGLKVGEKVDISRRQAIRFKEMLSW